MILIPCFHACLQCQFKFDHKPYSSLMSNDVMASLYVENGQRIGIQPEADPEKIRKAGGSTDMGNVSHVVPSLHPKFWIGTTASAHTPDFAKQASKFELGCGYSHVWLCTWCGRLSSELVSLHVFVCAHVCVCARVCVCWGGGRVFA